MIPAIPIGVGLALGLYYLYKRPANSAIEDDSDMEADRTTSAILAESLGWPYYYGKGAPSTPWASGPAGVDCSGFAQMALVRLGILSPGASDRGADTLANDSDPLAIGEQEPGDLAYYPGHVMVVASYPGADGHSQVIGASGGTRTTLGSNPDARVKLFDTALYRSDFVTYMRLKPEMRS